MTATITDRITLPGINPTAFEHPMDRTALEALRRTPGLDLVLKKLSSAYLERVVRLAFTADALRLSPQQCPRIYELLREACDVLDMPEPDLYLLQDPFPNAFAFGMERFTIGVTSGLVDLLDEDELRGVLGHELGHIKSGHMLYRTMAIFLIIIGLVAARNLPFISMITEALKYALFDWFRKSELSADRAGLLVTQDPDVYIRVLLKLAGGSTGVTHRLNVDAFLKQAEEYEELNASILDAFYSFEMTRFRPHPFPALRAREIRRWADSEPYKEILRGHYPKAEGKASERRCLRCDTALTNPLFRFCPECGAELADS